MVQALRALDGNSVQASDALEIKTIELRNLSFRFDKNAPIFEDVSLTLPAGENVLIAGANGSGKSAFLKILAGLLMPATGSYLLNQHDVAQMSFEEFLPFRKRIGYSFDFGGLLANRTLWDNLMLPLQYHNEVSTSEAESRVRDLVERFGLQTGKDRRPAAVSGGMRKACTIARAFVLDPEMLILDDPFVGLDREIISHLLELIGERRSQGRLKHVFFTSRGEAVSTKLGTRFLAIDGLNLRFDAEAEARLSRERKAANR